MSSYLALETVEEREYAKKHARWLRAHAAEVRPRHPEKAKEFDKDAEELEAAIRRREC